jgi:PAS domain S-box-containing protein
LVNKKRSEVSAIHNQLKDLQAEIEALKLHNQQLEIIMQETNKNSLSGNWELDLKSKKVKWSDSMYVLLELPEDVQPDMKLFYKKLPLESQDKLNGAIRKTIISQENYSFEHQLIINDDIKHARTNLKLVLGDDNIPVTLSGETNDITLLKSSQKELEKLSVIASKTSNGIVILNAECNIEWINQGFTMLTGYRMDEISGHAFKDFLTPEKLNFGDENFLARELSQNHTISDEIRLKTKHKNDLLLLINISPILDYELNPENYIVVLTDITTQRKVEEELRQAEKMAALGKLSAGLAHELNNPAAAATSAAGKLDAELENLETLSFKLYRFHIDEKTISSIQKWFESIYNREPNPDKLSSLELSDIEDDIWDWLESYHVEDSWLIASSMSEMGITIADLDRLFSLCNQEAIPVIIHWIYRILNIKEFADIVKKSTKSISELVNVVKSYSFMDQATIQHIDIHQGIEDTLKILGHKIKKGITINRIYDQTLPKIKVNGNELNQVWTNLIDNAIDATDNIGDITIRTFRKEDFINVEIEDNGPGIPEKIKSRIFDPFFTTKDVGKGTGLGLDISQRIINNQCKGKIDVESNPGRTVFSVQLPVTDQ